MHNKIYINFIQLKTTSNYLFVLIVLLFGINSKIYAQVPVNDLCSGAITLTPGVTCITTTGSTTGATDNNETGDCVTGTENAVWYKFVATATTHTITVDGITGFDAVLSVISACGSTTVPAGGACADFSGDGGIETRTLTGLTIGNTYYIQVHEYNGDLTANGFTICITGPPANDICSGAITLSSGSTCSATTGSTTGATDNNETGDCVTGTENAVWYKFVATSTTHTITVDGITGFDAVLSVISTCGTTTVPSGGACVDATGDGGIETRTLTGLTIGNTYYIQVHEFYGDQTANGFTICVTAPAPPCTEPTTQATINAYSNNTSGTSLTVNWSRGNGTAGVIVVARLTSTAAVNPTSGTPYTANAAFGSGNTTGTGNFVVYNGTGTSVNVTGLTANTSYTFTVYEYNTAGTCYKSPGSSSAVTTALLPGENCTNAQDLSTLSNPYSATTTGYANDISTCRTGAPDRIFYIDVPDGATIDIWETTNNYDEYEYVGYGATCPGTTQLNCWDNDGLAHTIWTNSTGSTQRVWWIQDALSSGVSGNFTLQWTLTAPCTQPTTQATINAYSNNTSGTSLTVNWSRGNGTAGVIVVARLTSTAAVNPTSGTPYTANAAFGSGNTTGTGNFVVYNGTGTSVNVTGLTANTSYTFTVYEYNTAGTCYKSPGSSSAVTTALLPGENCTNAQDLSTLSNPYSATTTGYANDISTCRTGAPDRIFYIDVPDGATIDIWETTNNYDEYEYVGYGATCPGTTQLNCWDNDGLAHTIWTNSTGSTQRVWWIQDALSSGASGNFTLQWTLTAPCTQPTTQATINAYSNNTTGTSLTVNWSRGNGTAGVIVVARLTSTTAVNPTSGTSYTANAAFGSGNTTGTGNFVVYNGTGTSVNVTGLTANTSYTFTVYEYSTTGTCYKSPGSSSAVTTAPIQNDICTGAFTLTPSTSCSPTTGSTVGASDNNETGDCTEGTENAVWYKFVATSTSHDITVDGISGFDAVIGVISGCGTTTIPTGGGCTDNNGSDGIEVLNLTGLTIGATYYIQVYDFQGDQTANGFTICVTVPYNPCASIPNLTCGTSVSPTIPSGTGAYDLSNCYFLGTPGKEVIYTFTPTTSGIHTINQTSSFGFIDYMFKAASGGCNSSGWTCIDDISGAGTATFTLTAGTQYYILLDPESTGGGSVSFSITCPTPPPANDECSGATTLTPGAPGAACSPTSGSTVTGYTESPYGCLDGYPDDDIWYKFVATSTSHTVTVDGASNFDAVVAVFTTDCNTTFTATTGGDCTDDTGKDGSETLNLTGLTIGNTYYVNVYDWWDNDWWFGEDKGGDFTICITTPGPPPNDNCAAAISITPTGPGNACSPTSGTTVGGSDSNVGCDDGTEDDDVWYSFIASSGTHIVTVDGNSGFRPVVGVYTTCGATVNAIGGNCVTAAANGDAVSLTLNSLSIGTTYFVKLHDHNTGGGRFTICVTTPSTSCPDGAPNNDEPCNAVSIPLGTIASGNNACATTLNEPAATPSCWTSGTRHTVWYAFTAPAGGSVKIKTAPGTLLNTQIAVYSGTCGTTLTQIGCNNDASSCGSTSLLISEVSLSGLTSGNTYYISVDGSSDNVGTFAITVINGSAAYPTSSGQECSAPNIVCSQQISVGDPGYQGIGFTCDQTGGGNCTTGERGSAWYQIDIAADGTLYFDIIPNDYTGSAGPETDYDFILWKITGTTGATNCAQITSTNGDNEVKCNFDPLGVTGLSPTGSAPAEFPGFDAAYETGAAVLAGETYLLVVQNFSNSLSGFTLDFKNTDPGVINTNAPSSVTWTGGSNTSVWNSTTNWGGCATPSCSINAVVSPSSSFQPNITAAMGIVNVRNLTVDPGAILTIGPGATLKVCESITNNGTIVAHPTSTVLFNDNYSSHTLNGTLSGSSSLGNLVITDETGSTNCTVTANTDLEILGNFTTTNSTSIFNMNGRNMLLAGNFTNASGASTFTNTANSTITFSGSTLQTYSPYAINATPVLTLNNVVLNNSGSGVILSTTNTPDMVLGTNGVLILTSGKIVTPNNQEVTLTNTAPDAVSVGNTGSYIEGNLRRNLAAGATGSFNFPVGNAATGYQLANINFTTAAAASPINLLARFNSWGGAWTLPGAPGWGPECLVYYNLPYLDNGYWSLNASAPSNGLYNLTLYNRGYTNAGSASGWSVAKSPSASASWALEGICVPTTSPSPVMRNGMSGFSNFGTVQSTSPLPVELSDFSAKCINGEAVISWTTLSESNSKEFIIEKSKDAVNFEKAGLVPASGYSNYILNYSFTDEQVTSSSSYYRLKIVDLDGTYAYSVITELNCETIETGFQVYVYPEQGIIVKAKVSESDLYDFQLYDASGRRVYALSKLIESGSSVFFMEAKEQLSKGIYMFRITNSKGEKILVKKLWVD
jgi:hypothetical protein